ncbi:hypothetical protein [Vandammella animalimorsus]|uniref:hypothetical protein n=1 Tax=Vandammella animalimorsus TaxID=2029117 RepID=UPI00117877BC|nr:hypothetical protein [Vandammella animalimorsus]
MNNAAFAAFCFRLTGFLALAVRCIWLCPNALMVFSDGCCGFAGTGPDRKKLRLLLKLSIAAAL